jgi:predicted ATPase/DNA-binding SARP family transcriptional activator
MQVGLLGPVEISAGTPAALSGLRRKAVLAVLALHPGELVSADRLIDAVWGDQPPATAPNALQAHVSYLRRAFGNGKAIISRPPGYQLGQAAGGTDLQAAQRLIDQAQATEAPHHATALLRASLALWRGPSLDDVRDIDYLGRHAARLDELRLLAIQMLLDTRLALGEHADLVPELEQLVIDRPFQEGLHGRLMTALYRSGRQADALAAYQSLRRLLADELGVEPSTSIRQLEAAILQQDPALDPPRGPVLDTAGSGAAVAGEPPGSGPAQNTGHPALSLKPRPPPTSLSPFVGRATEMALLERLLTSARLVTITGTGGSGKTRLSITAASHLQKRFADGVAFADLSSVSAETIAGFLAEVLGVGEEPQHSPAETVRAALADRDLLLVLDSCEHLLDSVAHMVEPLLAAAPSCRVLATSREPLRVPGEACLPLKPMAVPPPEANDVNDLLSYPAMTLLVQRATDADPAFRLTEVNARPMADLCRGLDGLPLALELAAVRLRAMTPAELLIALNDRQGTLGSGARTAPARHRSLSAAMEWSYELLTSSEQETFRRFSVFRGGGTPAHAAAVCRPDAPMLALENVARLIDKSLLLRTEHGQKSRLDVHQTLQRYAASLLGAADEVGTMARRHAEVFLEFAQNIGAPRRPSVINRGGLGQLREEGPNFQAALEWTTAHDVDFALRLGGALWWYWFRDGRAALGRDLLSQALSAPGATASPGYAEALAGAAYLAWVQDDYDLARMAAQQVLDRPETTVATQAMAYGVLARAAGDSGDFTVAAEHAAHGAVLYEKVGDPWGAAWSRRCQASALIYGSDPQAGRALAQACLTAFEALGDDWGSAGAVDQLAAVASRLGEQRLALDLAADAVARHRELGDSSGERYALQHLAEAARAAGDSALAARTARQSLALAREGGYRVGALQALLLLAELTGDSATSGQAAELAHQLNDSQSLARALAASRQESHGQEIAWDVP